MPLLIDCYNVLHAEKPELLAGLDEISLCKALATGPWRSDRIVLVCDGKPKPLGFSNSPVDNVEVIYSGPLLSADELIIQMVNRDTAPRRLMVISSDRQIRTLVRRRGAKSISSELFLKSLANYITGKNEQNKVNAGKFHDQQIPSDQVDQWLRDFGYDPSEHSRQKGDDPASEKDDSEDLEGIWPPW